MKYSWNSALRVVALIIHIGIYPLLISCGGGVLGSGGGGGSPNPKPPTIDEIYSISNLPLQLSAALPASLSQDGEADNRVDPARPLHTVKTSAGELVDNKLAMGQMQLYIDSGWDSIVSYCELLPDPTICSLQNSGLTVAYTESMALWEIQLRTGVGQEISGLSSTQTAEQIEEIKSQVSGKIGSQIQLDSVMFERFDGQEFVYTVTMIIDEESRRLLCKLSWDSSKQLVHSSVTKLRHTNQAGQYFETLFDNTDDTSKNQYKLSKTETGSELEINLSLERVPSTDEFYVQSSIVETSKGTTKDINSRGKVGEEAGYLFSEVTVGRGNTQTTVLHRQVFKAEPVSAATCNPSDTTTACSEGDDWVTTIGSDPTDSPLYVDNETLESNNNSDNFNTKLSNVPLTAAYSFVLLDSDKITIDPVSLELTLTIPGIGPFVWPTDLTDVLTGSYADYPSQAELLTAYNDAVICRFDPDDSPDRATTGILYAACNAVVQDILDAHVISESVVHLLPQLQFEPDVVVSIIP